MLTILNSVSIRTLPRLVGRYPVAYPNINNVSRNFSGWSDDEEVGYKWIYGMMCSGVSLWGFYLWKEDYDLRAKYGKCDVCGKAQKGKYTCQRGYCESYSKKIRSHDSCHKTFMLEHEKCKHCGYFFKMDDLRSHIDYKCKKLERKYGRCDICGKAECGVYVSSCNTARYGCLKVHRKCSEKLYGLCQGCNQVRVGEYAHLESNGKKYHEACKPVIIQEHESSRSNDKCVTPNPKDCYKPSNISQWSDRPSADNQDHDGCMFDTSTCKGFW